MFRQSIPVALLMVGFAAPALAGRPPTVDTSRAGAVELSFDFEQSDTAAYTLEFEQTIEVLTGGSDVIEASGTVPIRTEVLNVADGIAQIAISLDRPQLSIAQGDEALPVREAMDALQATRVTRSIRGDGRNVDAVGRFSDEGTDVGIAGMTSDTLPLVWPELPPEAAIGDSWVQTAPMWEASDSATLRAEQTMRYTLAGFATTATGDVAVIDFDYTAIVGGEIVRETESMGTVQVDARTNGTGYVLFSMSAREVTEVGLTSGRVYVFEDVTGAQTVIATDSTMTVHQ